MKLFLIIVIILLWTLTKGQNPGDLDENFGEDGIARIDYYGNDEYAYDAVIQPFDNKIVLAGCIEFSGNTDILVLRLNPDGTLDNTFGLAGFSGIDINSYDCVYGIAMQGDKILAIGYTLNEDNEEIPILIRLNENGTIDDYFGQEGIFYADEAFAHLTSLFVDKYENIFLGGYHEQSSWIIGTIAKVELNGNDYVESFNGNGIYHMGTLWNDSKVWSIKLQDDGKIVFGGSYENDSGELDFMLGRLESYGQQDISFGEAGFAFQDVYTDDDVCKDIHICDNDYILAAGSAFYSSGSGDNDYALMSFDTNGQLNTSFNNGINGGIKTINFLNASDDKFTSMVLQPDGKICMGGYSDFSEENNSDFAITRLLSNGINDIEFGDGAIVRTSIEYLDYCNSLCISNDYGLIAAGSTRSFVGSESDIIVTKYHTGLYVDLHENEISEQSCLVYPNPVGNENLIIEYNLEKGQKVAANLLTVKGNKIYKADFGFRKSGSHRETIILPERIEKGLYLLQFRKENISEYIPIIKI